MPSVQGPIIILTIDIAHCTLSALCTQLLLSQLLMSFNSGPAYAVRKCSLQFATGTLYCCQSLSVRVFA